MEYPVSFPVSKFIPAFISLAGAGLLYEVACFLPFLKQTKCTGRQWMRAAKMERASEY